MPRRKGLHALSPAVKGDEYGASVWKFDDSNQIRCVTTSSGRGFGSDPMRWFTGGLWTHLGVMVQINGEGAVGGKRGAAGYR
jgi:hypothetical protein